jgi:hypothetical protein
MWFEHPACGGTTMPVARDSPSIQGDVPGPDPARAPPNKAIAQAGLACRGQPAGVYLASARSATRSAAAPTSGTCRSTIGPHGIGAERSPAVRRSRRSPVPSRGNKPRWKTSDKDEVGGASPPRPTVRPSDQRRGRQGHGPAGRTDREGHLLAAGGPGHAPRPALPPPVPGGWLRRRSGSASVSWPRSRTGRSWSAPTPSPGTSRSPSTRCRPRSSPPSPSPGMANPCASRPARAIRL